MRIADGWREYELLDASAGERLERWGDILLIRPDPQVIWNTPKTDPRWKDAHARYCRSSAGGGHWETYKKIPDVWKIHYGDLTFRLKPMGFKHTGVFPEQAVNWDLMAHIIRAEKEKNPGREIRVLNLFGYTGAATLACMRAGAHVTHVDAAKGMVQWARENAEASGLSDRPVRWLVDDCVKFVRRELRRGNKYDGIVMDPPSYGRGPGGEVWKLEDQIYEFLTLCLPLLGQAPLFLLLNSYTAGLSPSVMAYMLSALLVPARGGTVSAEEIALPVSRTGLALPAGSTAVWRAE